VAATRKRKATYLEGRTMDSLLRPNFRNLPSRERQALLKDLALPHGFAWKRFERFERFGAATDTAVYTFEGSEFVFVPGDTVTLGWDSFAAGPDADTRHEMEEALAEWEVKDGLEAFLRASMSPVRTRTIGPMLVERTLRGVGWRRVPFDSSEIERSSDFCDGLKRIQGGECRKYTLNRTFRLQRNGEEITVDLFDEFSYAEFTASIQRSGFRLPTEDEWEYLCGGGSRTLFRWGDSFDFDFQLRLFGVEEEQDDLEKPNQFGLSIAYDPYKYEVLMDSEQFLKGGDGGGNLCGGCGLVMGYLPIATYFRDPYSTGGENRRFRAVIGGDYTFYRRVIRL
jgi:hypothetical protein